MRRRKKKPFLTILLFSLSILLFLGSIGLGVFALVSFQKNRDEQKKTEEVMAINRNQEIAIQNITKSIQELETNIQALNMTSQSMQASLKDYQNRRDLVASEQGASADQEAQTLQPQQEAIPDYAPGELITHPLAAENIQTLFTSSPIQEGDEIYERINGRSYRQNPDIGLSQLRYLKLPHYNFSHQLQMGEMVVNQYIAEDTLNVFKELLANEYEIQSIFLIDNYWTGDGTTTDNASIEVNNTSCFNYREVTGGSSLSNHAYGLAIDINPQQNPYVWHENGNPVCYHSNAWQYLDRYSGDPHVIVQGDICYQIFSRYGFSWGGLWTDPIDYQHFEKPM